MRKSVKTLAAAGLALLGVYSAAGSYKNYRFQELGRTFPFYVAAFEMKYGRFADDPQLVFQDLPFDVRGRIAGNHLIAVNDSTLNYLLFPDKKSTMLHEMGHLVVENMYRQAKPSWLVMEGGINIVNKRMGRQLVTITEGSADYISLQNSGRNTSAHSADLAFVRPVLDALGTNEGIRKLLLEPPTDEEMKYPEKYYARIFR